jgi:hypothetical protein
MMGGTGGPPANGGGAGGGGGGGPKPRETRRARFQDGREPEAARP